jgi:Spirocyclase AveC-like
VKGPQVATIARSNAVSGGFPPDLQSRSSRPVLWWATAGILLLIFQVVVLARWVAGPNFTATDPGPDKLPAWQSPVFTVLQIGVPVGAVALLYFAVIRPRLRNGYLTTDAMIALAASTVFFWDMVMNYTSVTLFYNSHLINRGAWANGAWPTWTSPHANKLPEPLLIVPPAYTALVFSQVLVILWLLRKAKTRWPGMGVVGTIATIVVGLTLTDTLVEGLVLRTGAYAYPGGIRAITLLAGHTYQIPMSETVLFGGFALGAIACLSYFRDDRGHTLVERGISTLTLNFKGKQAVKFFAIYGAIHLGFVVLYMIPQQWFATHSDPFPAGYPSYMVNDMCAAGADGHTCPGPGVLMPRPTHNP